jgi:hypothetical protein
MTGFGKSKLPNPSTNTSPSSTQQYLQEAMGVSPVVRPPKKKKVQLDPGGQPYRGQNKLA